MLQLSHREISCTSHQTQEWSATGLSVRSSAFPLVYASPPKGHHEIFADTTRDW